MKRTEPLVGLAVALLLTIGCEGAPSQNVDVRSILVNPHIVMGKDVNIEDIPYQISIETMRIHTCGGAIISENWVITAAHCIDSEITSTTYSKRIRAGATTVIPVVGWSGKIHQIANLRVHLQWDKSKVDYDVGIIKVSNKFIDSERIQAIAMPPAGESFLEFDRIAQVSGWGRTQPDDAISFRRHLQFAEIPLVPRARCSKLFEGAPARTPNITSRMLCGGGTGNGGPCLGDSGGPVVHKGELVGLVSWGIGCNHPTYPNVFTNLLNDEIRGFVKENTGV